MKNYLFLQMECIAWHYRQKQNKKSMLKYIFASGQRTEKISQRHSRTSVEIEQSQVKAYISICVIQLSMSTLITLHYLTCFYNYRYSLLYMTH